MSACMSAKCFYGNIGSEGPARFHRGWGRPVNEVSRHRLDVPFGRSRTAGIVGVSERFWIHPGEATWSPTGRFCAARHRPRAGPLHPRSRHRLGLKPPAGSYERYSGELGGLGPHRVKPERHQRGHRQHDAERETSPHAIRLPPARRRSPRPIICQKPSRADCRGRLFSPNGESAPAPCRAD